MDSIANRFGFQICAVTKSQARMALILSKLVQRLFDLTGSELMINRIAMIAMALAALLSFAPAHARDIVVSQAWSRATPGGSKVAAGYLTVENHSARSDRLVSASSAASAKLEIHQMTDIDGIMTMRPLDDGLAIPPDATVTLAPGGSHIMFIGDVAPFEEGQRVPVALNFEHAGTIETIFEVGSVGAKGPRLQIASAEAVAVEPPRSVVTDSFFTHICGARVMANVTVTPGRTGPVEVLVQLEDGDEKPLGVDALSVILVNRDESVVPTVVAAERVTNDSWRARMTAAAAGIWSLSLRIEVTKDDRVDIAAPIIIE
jgi:periplasmic copper chaperone A